VTWTEAEPYMRTNARRLVGVTRTVVLVLLVVSGAFCAPRLKDAPSPVGQWRALQSFQGKDMVEHQVPTFILAASGRYESRNERDEIVAKGRFAVNPAAIPAEIDIFPDKPSNPNDTRRLGIYRVVGDRMELVISLNGTRPSVFEPVDNQEVMFSVLERQK
jgi:uncharacterized protein (TIGR03067 family)